MEHALQGEKAACLVKGARVLHAIRPKLDAKDPPCWHWPAAGLGF